MASKDKYFRVNPVSLARQKGALCSNYCNSICEIQKNQLVWSGIIKPTPLSKEYKVLLFYQLRKTPKVWIVGDELEKLDSPEFPHKFEIKENDKMVRICLYRYSEFNSQKMLANTIIPWTVEWLYFYEMWLATGEWLGGGEHINSASVKIDDE